jgi:hypothetical protein
MIANPAYARFMIAQAAAPDKLTRQKQKPRQAAGLFAEFAIRD